MSEILGADADRTSAAIEFLQAYGYELRRSKAKAGWAFGAGGQSTEDGLIRDTVLEAAAARMKERHEWHKAEAERFRQMASNNFASANGYQSMYEYVTTGVTDTAEQEIT